MRPTVRYGIDAPLVVAALGAGGVVTFAAASGLGRAELVVVGSSLLLTALAMVSSSLIAKPRAVQQLLGELALAEDEQLLDIGCGRGLLLVAAAERVPRGHLVGIDSWRARDQSGNSRGATNCNLQRAQVGDRCQVITCDARELPFDDACFDVVVSSLMLHNLPTAAERARVLAEMVRVLRPGGRVAILDIARTAQHAEILEQAGLAVTRHRAAWLFPPAHIVTAHKLVDAKPVDVDTN